MVVELELPFRLPFRLLRFAGRVLRMFVDNRGFVLAAALAFNALLSAIPLLVIAIAVLSRVLDREALLTGITGELEHLLAAGSASLLTDAVAGFLDGTGAASIYSVAGLLLFSTAGFRALDGAIDLIFRFRHGTHARRTLWASALMSTVFVVGFVIALVVRVGPRILGLTRGLWAVPSFVASFLSAALLMAAVYRFMPVGGARGKLALVGGVTAAALWEGLQGLVVWYFGEWSAVNFIYGSIGSIVVVLVTLEVGASIVLLGAQVIAELERSEDAGVRWDSVPPR